MFSYSRTQILKVTPHLNQDAATSAKKNKNSIPQSVLNVSY